MKRYLTSFLICLFVLVLPSQLWAQKHSIRVEAPSILIGHINLDYGIAVNPNLSIHLPVFVKPITLGVPAPVGALMSFDTMFTEHLNSLGEVSPIKHWIHAGLEPGVRYWTNGVYNRGVFFGFHLLGKIFRYGGHSLERSYREGYAMGGFISVGYCRDLSARWGLELELGLGGQYRVYDRYTLSGSLIARGSQFVPAVSRLGVQLVYLL